MRRGYPETSRNRRRLNRYDVAVMQEMKLDPLNAEHRKYFMRERLRSKSRPIGDRQ